MPFESGRLHIANVAIAAGVRSHTDVIHAGEIVGLAGLDGSGQGAFLEILAGRRRPSSGRVAVVAPSNSEVILRSLAQAAHHGIAYLPRDRRRTGIFPALSVLDNFGVVSFDWDTRGGLISKAKRRARYETWRVRLSIAATDPDAPITSLSGGNQQKVLIARWLARNPRVLLLDDPTRGVDQRTRETLYALFRDLAQQGMALVILSSEIEEIVRLCNRVLIFRDQHVITQLTADAMTYDGVIAAMFGRLS